MKTKIVTPKEVVAHRPFFVEQQKDVARTTAYAYCTLPRFVWFFSSLAGFFAILAVAQAQDLEPRAYANTPVGLNFLIVGYSYSQGGLSTDPSIPLQNAKLQTNSSVFAYARSLDVFGLSGKFDVIQPTSWLAGSATLAGQSVDRTTSGFGDPRFRFSVNLYGAPALSLDEFKDYQQDIIIGASVQVTAPGGEYTPSKLVNIGSNRWSVKPELGISKRFGDLTLELSADATFYTDNNEFLGTHTRSQDPIYALQSHIIYSLPYGIWAALDGTFYAGGDTTIDGKKSNDMQENTRIGATLALPLSRNYSTKLYWSTGVVTRFGTSFDTVGILFQYRFGGGI